MSSLAIKKTSESVARVAFVTGASRGLGAEFVLQYAKAGWRVIAGSRAGTLPESLQGQQGLDVIPMKLDVADSASVDALKEELEAQSVAIDCLINNAGVALNRGANLAEVNYNEWEETLKVNVLGAHRVIAALLPSLTRSGPNFKIACISSDLGSIGITLSPLPYDLWSTDVSYRSSKAALNMTAACVTAELRKTHPEACVLAIHPGWVNTDMGNRGGKVKPPLEAPEVVEGIISVIAAATPDKSGSFVSWQGEDLPW